MNKEIFAHQHRLTKADREKLNQHKAFVLWFTGLSGSGKSTIASEVEYRLFKKYIRTMILDGDNIRLGLNKDLGFSPEERKENIRRVAETAKILTEAGVVGLVCLISPYIVDRQAARALLDQGDFVEIFVKCDPAVCRERDPKNLYQKALKGEITNFTGVSAPYEEPTNPELVLESDRFSIETLAEKVISYLKNHKYL